MNRTWTEKKWLIIMLLGLALLLWLWFIATFAQIEWVAAVVLTLVKGVGIVTVLWVLHGLNGAIERSVALKAPVAVEEERAVERLPEPPRQIALRRIARLISSRPEESARVIRMLMAKDNRQSTYQRV